MNPLKNPKSESADFFGGLPSLTNLAIFDLGFIGGNLTREGALQMVDVALKQQKKE